MASFSRRVKNALHPRLDPLLSKRDEWRVRRALSDLRDGTYAAPVSVPYRPQFATPELIHATIHGGFDATQDPNWRAFGAEDPTDYAFWAPRICPLACLQMAIAAFSPGQEPTLWQLVKYGLDLRGYTVRDEFGNWVDEGWTYPALVGLAERYGLGARGFGYASLHRACDEIRRGALVMVSVSPELGERDPRMTRYGGHFALITGFEWRNGSPLSFTLHNPSGRYAELQANAVIPTNRLRALYGYRLIALTPASHAAETAPA